MKLCGLLIFLTLVALAACVPAPAPTANPATASHVTDTATPVLVTETAEPPRTPTMPTTETPIPVTAAPSATAPAPATVPATATETDVPLPVFVEFDSVQIEIAGKPVTFTIGTEEGSADIRQTWDAWGVSEIRLNHPQPDHTSDRLGKLIKSSLALVSDAGYAWWPEKGDFQAVYNDFTQNSNKYLIYIPGTPNFTLDQVTGIRYTFIDIKDPRLSGKANQLKSGFSFSEDGTLSIYDTSWPVWDVLPNIEKYAAYKGKGLEQWIGENLANGLPFHFFDLYNRNSPDIRQQVLTISGSTSGHYATIPAAIVDLKTKSLWYADLTK